MLTNTEGSGRGCRWALAFAAAVAALLSIAATVALADEEDDPSFDADGTLLSVIDPGVDPVTDPVVDQGHDGGVLTAVGVVGFPTGTDDRGTATSQLRVLRLDAGGVPSALDGDGLVAVPSPQLGDLFDIEGLADGRIVIASSGFAPPGRARGFGVGDTLVITVLASNGDILDQYLRVAPPECSQGATEEEPYPAVAEIDPTGRVYVVWDDCVESPLLARYLDGVDDSVELIDPMVPVELALGPAGDVFILGATDLPNGAERAIVAGSIVVRHDGESLDEVPYGGGKETAAFLPGDPVDITVDPSNRAVVWTESSTCSAAAAPRGACSA